MKNKILSKSFWSIFLGLFLVSIAIADADAAPAAPTNLIARPSVSRIDLSWDYNYNDALGFNIWFGFDGKSFGYLDSVDYVVGNNHYNYPHTGLGQGQTYYYRITAYNNSGDSSPYPTPPGSVSATTPIAPNAPSNLKAYIIPPASPIQIQLTWTNNSINVDSFQIERKIGSSGGWLYLGSANTPTYVDDDNVNLADNIYYYRVRAFGSGLYSGPSNEVKVSFAAPTNLTGTIASASQINLTWTNNATCANSVTIERKIGNGNWPLPPTPFATVGITVHNYSDKGLTIHDIYNYRVRAYNNILGYTNYSECSVDFRPPDPHTILSATSISANKIALNWTYTSSNEQGFQIERKTGASDSSNPWKQITTVGVVTSFTDKGSLNPNTTYTYRVRAYNKIGYSDYSNNASATTWSSTCSIAGRITLSDGSGLGGILVSAVSAGHNYSATTVAPDGNFTISNLPPGQSYIVTPEDQNYNFIPAFYEYSNLVNNITGCDFTATPKTYTISGTVRGEEEGPLNEVPVSFDHGAATVFTHSNGEYIQNGFPNGTYAVTVQPIGYPQETKSVIINDANADCDFDLSTDYFEEEGNKESEEPIDLHNGNFIVRATDLTIPGRGLNLEIKRVYESRMVYNGPFGWNWDFNYNMRLRDKGDKVFFYHSGRKDVYTKIGVTGGVTTYSSPAGHFDQLIKNADGSFTDTEKDGTKYNFASFGTAHAGQLTIIRDRFGNVLSFAYYIDGIRIIDTLGRQIFLTLTNGKISQITDCRGRRIQFIYNGDYLEEVRYPENVTIQYTYDSSESHPLLKNNLLSITDGEGTRYVENTYYDTDALDPLTFDRVKTQYWNGAPRLIILTYGKEDGNAVTTYTDREGNRTEYTFNDFGYVKKEKKIGESDVFITRHEYNQNKQRTKTIYPDGLEVSWTYDNKGNVLSETRKPSDGSASQVISFTYEPRFNLVKSITDARGFITTNYFDYEEATLGDLNGDGRTNQALGLIAKTVYPRCDLDLNGSQDTVEKKFIYNDQGQLLKEIDPLGYITYYEYPNGYLSKKIVDYGDSTHLNLETTYEYGVDNIGNIHKITDPNLNVTQIDYDDLNRVTKVILPEPFNYQTIFEYDNNNNLKKKKEQTIDSENEFWTTQYVYENDNLKRKLQEIQPVADDNLEYAPVESVAITQQDYNWEEKPSLSTSPAGRKIQINYNRRLLPKEIIYDPDGIGATVELQYDAGGRLESSIDPNDNETRYEYDGFGRLKKVTQPEGNYKWLYYDANNNITGIEFYDSDSLHTLLSKTQYFYNALGYCYQVNSAIINNGAVSSYITSKYKFDKLGRIIEEIDPNNNRTTYFYDAAGRLIKKVDDLGNINLITYDGNSNVIEERTQEVGETTDFVIKYRYDNLNRLTQIDYYGRIAKGTAPQPGQLKYSEIFSYDAQDNLKEKIDGEENLTRYSYDGLGRKIKEEQEYRVQAGQPEFLTTQFNYDKDGNLFSFKDAQNNTTQYQYNSLGNKRKTIYPDGKEINYEYDSASRLKKEIKPDSTTIDYTYDNNNRLTDKDIVYNPSRAGAVTYEEFTYDGLNQLKSAKNDFSEVQFSYDSLGRKTKESLNIIGSGLKDISATYDDVGNLTELTYPDGTRIKYVPDSLGRVTKINSSSGATYVSYQFKGINRVIKKSLRNNTRLEISYDELDRPTTYKNLLSSGAAVSWFDSQFNNVNNRTNEIDHNRSKTLYFSYDKAQRLTKIEEPGGIKKEEFNLDLAGNRLGNNKVNGVSVDYVEANNLNQYTTVNNQSLLYDDSGNLIKDAAKDAANHRTYMYDYANRLITAKDAAGNTILRFTYDALGRRIKKAEAIGETKYYNFGEYTIYKERASNIEKFIYGPGTDEIICMIKGANTYYYHPKALGTITSITDQSGRLAESYEYDSSSGRVEPTDSFGNLTVRNSQNAVIPASNAINFITYTAREYEPSIDKYYYRARFYDPYLGRFMQRDPIGYNAGQNLYTYCDNNPINFTDPLGLQVKEEYYLKFVFVRPSNPVTGLFASKIWWFPNKANPYHVGFKLSDGSFFSLVRSGLWPSFKITARDPLLEVGEPYGIFSVILPVSKELFDAYEKSLKTADIPYGPWNIIPGVENLIAPEKYQTCAGALSYLLKNLKVDGCEFKAFASIPLGFLMKLMEMRGARIEEYDGTVISGPNWYEQMKKNFSRMYAEWQIIQQEMAIRKAEEARRFAESLKLAN